jgi:hypothetical protein
VVQLPAGAADLPLLHSIQTSAGAHPDFHSMDMGSCSPGVMLPRHETDHSAPSSAEVE